MKEDDDNQDDDCDDDGEHDQEFKDWLDAKVPDAATASRSEVVDKSPECATCGLVDCICTSINIR
jgi:hypothetical protein